MKNYESMTKKELIDAVANTGFRKESLKGMSRDELIQSLKDNDKARKMSLEELFEHCKNNGLI